jgi:ferredoxin
MQSVNTQNDTVGNQTARLIHRLSLVEGLNGQLLEHISESRYNLPVCQECNQTLNAIFEANQAVYIATCSHVICASCLNRVQADPELGTLCNTCEVELLDGGYYVGRVSRPSNAVICLD